MKPSTRILLCFILLLPVPVKSAYAQSSIGSQTRTIVVNVLDHDGNMVRDLKPTEFRAEFRGRPLKVLSSSTSSAPRRVVVLVDLSGSLLRVEKLVHLLAEDVVNSMPREKLRPAIVLFSDHILGSIDFSHSRDEVEHMLTELPPSSGRTALWDALIYATDILGQPLPGDSIYLISDGWESASKVRRNDVETELLARGIRLFSFNPGESEPTTIQEERDAAFVLHELADLTGATVPIIKVEPFRERFASILQRSYHQTTEFYELHVELPAEPITKRQRWDLQVVDGQGKKRKGLYVIYPREFVPCAKGTPAN